jgi:NitT/TauT family transport system ATP-binding protein
VSDEIVIVSHIFKSFQMDHQRRSARTIPVLKDLSFTVKKNEFLAILGPSGCGKTTLLKLIDGLLSADAGEILLDGKRPMPNEQIGMVFQDFRLLPWWTVAQNIKHPLRLRRVPKQETTRRTKEYIHLVGLDGFENSYPHELSSGMQQRVGLARALVMEPKILLMDEPFASLDAQNREFMQIELSELWSKKKRTVIFVTHSLDEALFLTDRIVLLSSRPSSVQEVVDVPLARPRSEYDYRSDPDFIRLRTHLWNSILTMAKTDHKSELQLSP